MLLSLFNRYGYIYTKRNRNHCYCPCISSSSYQHCIFCSHIFRSIEQKQQRIEKKKLKCANTLNDHDDPAFLPYSDHTVCSISNQSSVSIHCDSVHLIHSFIHSVVECKLIWIFQWNLIVSIICCYRWMCAVKHLERSIYYVRASVAIQMRIRFGIEHAVCLITIRQKTKQSTTHDEIIMHLLWLVHIICILYYWNRCVTILYL